MNLTYSSGFSDRTEQFHLCLNRLFDRLKTRCKKFTRVKSFALLILTSLDILAGCLCKCQLALSIYINLRYT